MSNRSKGHFFVFSISPYSFLGLVKIFVVRNLPAHFTRSRYLAWLLTKFKRPNLI